MSSQANPIVNPANSGPNASQQLKEQSQSNNLATKEQTENLDEIFKEYEEDTLILLKRFSEIYHQSDLAEQKFRDDINHLSLCTKEYRTNLTRKLSQFKEFISKFSKILNI
ncbi:unnamed protein product [Brachionus calyciflorus]|uniref:Uncharacterized protein n=1 Tax=Brachionus calyciflorus TaxID=104777 RepID=A0A813WSH4_9BILA|nr:unnamed protein product [Brachionus calyciflorus]